MKKIYILSLLFCLSFGFTKAQTTLSVATDFTVTDTHGSTHNLFGLLASGKYVCLDFFFVTCPACIATCDYYKQTFTNFGCNTQDIYFISIDNGDTDAQCDQYEVDHLGGSAGYPAISGTTGGGNAVTAAYGVSAFPTYILIAPDHSIVEQDMWPISSSASFDGFITPHGLTHKACLSGVDEQTADNNVSLYPNPAVNTVTVDIVNGGKASSIKVFDILGKTVISEEVNNIALYELNVSNLEKGMYYMEIVTEQKSVIVKKFNKQ